MGSTHKREKKSLKIPLLIRPVEEGVIESEVLCVSQRNHISLKTRSFICKDDAKKYIVHMDFQTNVTKIGDSYL